MNPLYPCSLLAAASFFVAVAAQAQTGGVRIGTAGTPDPSAVLDVVSANKGVLLPRVTSAAALATPATGLLVYQTGAPAGFYYNAGTAAAPAWTLLGAADNLGSHTATQALNLAGQLLVGGTASAPGTAGLAVDAAGNVGIGIGIPLARLHLSEGEALFAAAGDVPATPTAPGVSGRGRRAMWYADKAAFRAGYVDGTQWDNATVGRYSFATGWNPRASGQYAFAAGYATTASGETSVALGTNGTASGARAFSFNGTATAAGAIAFGSGAQATGDDALALGPSGIAGGLASIVLGPSIANGSFAVAIGLQNQANGQFATVMGKNARANHQGSMTFGDASASFSSDFVTSTANNQMTMRFAGGYNLISTTTRSNNGSNNNDGGPASGVSLAPGAGSWTTLSDRRAKENFRPLDPEQVLSKVAALPVTEWNYRSQPASQRHVGPMAQDFYAAFRLDGIGRDTTINTGDIDGVNMLAIQGLYRRVQALGADNVRLRQQLEQLRAQVAAVPTGRRAPAHQRTANQLAALQRQNAALQARATQAEAQAAQATAATETFEARLRRLEAGSAQARR